MNVIAQVEFELAYYDIASQYFSHYVTKTSIYLWDFPFLNEVLLSYLGQWNIDIFRTKVRVERKSSRSDQEEYDVELRNVVLFLLFLLYYCWNIVL